MDRRSMDSRMAFDGACTCRRRPAGILLLLARQSGFARHGGPAAQHILETHTRPASLKYDEDGFPHGLIGEKLTKEEHEFLQSSAITAFDNDSGMTMLRIGSMNLMLHGIEHPHFTYADTLSKAFKQEKQYDLILANPPFKGAIDSSDVNPTLPTKGL